MTENKGEYDKPIELKYIQIPHEIYEYLVIDMQYDDIGKRKDALWAYFINYFTNIGYANLKLQNPSAYSVCKAIDKMSFIVQNKARWTCYEEFYDGRDDIDYYTAAENWKNKKKEKKKESNRRQYLRRKQEEYNPEKEREEGKRLFDEACKKHGLKD